eukprot:1020097-Prymnesium_polylepis.2
MAARSSERLEASLMWLKGGRRGAARVPIRDHTHQAQLRTRHAARQRTRIPQDDGAPGAHCSHLGKA